MCIVEGFEAESGKRGRKFRFCTGSPFSRGTRSPHGSLEACMARRVLAVLGLLVLSSVEPLMAADNTIHLSVDASKSGTKIDRNIFGQFAENLCHGLYEGIWVGPDSPIPNT